MCRFYFWSQFGHISPSDGAKNCLQDAKMKTSFRKLSQDCVELWCFWSQIWNLREQLRLLLYRGDFGIIINFYKKLGSKSSFWSKSCFCCSRTASSVPDQTDPWFGFAMVESTSDYLEFLYIWNTLYAPLPFFISHFRQCRANDKGQEILLHEWFAIHGLHHISEKHSRRRMWTTPND